MYYLRTVSIHIEKLPQENMNTYLQKSIYEQQIIMFTSWYTTLITQVRAKFNIKNLFTTSLVSIFEINKDLNDSFLLLLR